MTADSTGVDQLSELTLRFSSQLLALHLTVMHCGLYFQRRTWLKSSHWVIYNVRECTVRLDRASHFYPLFITTIGYIVVVVVNLSTAYISSDINKISPVFNDGDLSFCNELIVLNYIIIIIHNQLPLATVRKQKSYFHGGGFIAGCREALRLFNLAWFL